MNTTIRIGTRRSRLALWQAYYVRDALLAAHSDIAVELVEMVTEGDKTLDVPLSQKGGKGLFLKELETALLDNKIDIAVHSMKDVTVNLPDGLHIPVICQREDPRDAWVSNKHDDLASLPKGAHVGTTSLRRQSILRFHYPHLRVSNLRGNVDTRLGKLDAGEFDGIILATAGLLRLDLNIRIRQSLATDTFIPAVGQGAVGIECREDDKDISDLLAPLNHTPTQICVSAERAANACLEGGCHVPVAAYATRDGDDISLNGMVGTVDGTRQLRSQASGKSDQAEDIGTQVAEDLIAQGASDILNAAYAQG